MQIRGPAVADVAEAFAGVWSYAGPDLPDSELAVADKIDAAGDIAVRMIAGEPGRMQLYRLDQVIAAAARSYLWLTDAYFVGTPWYTEALRAAARDGVDVYVCSCRAPPTCP